MNLKNASIFSFIVFAIFLIFPSEKRGLLVAFLAFPSLIYFISERKIFIDKTLFINVSIYVLYALSTFFITGNLTSKRLETTLSILIMPIIFAIFYKSNKNVFSKKAWIYFIITFFISAIIFSIVVYTFFAFYGYFNSDVSYGYCISKLDEKAFILHDHPIYISITLSIAVLLSSTLIKHYDSNKKLKIIIIALNGVLIFTIFFLSRKGVITAFVLSAITLIALQVELKKRTIIKSIVLLIVTISLLFIIPTTQKRVLELFKAATYTRADETNSTNNRLQIYKCSWLLIKEKPIIGYGIDQDREELNKCYKNTLYYLYEHKFNTHNQYFSILMKTGIVGLLIFLIFLGYNIRLSLISKNWLFFSILVFFSIILLFENILERQNGIILFSFLINYFAYKSKLSINSIKRRT